MEPKELYTLRQRQSSWPLRETLSSPLKQAHKGFNVHKQRSSGRLTLSRVHSETIPTTDRREGSQDWTWQLKKKPSIHHINTCTWMYVTAPPTSSYNFLQVNHYCTKISEYKLMTHTTLQRLSSSKNNNSTGQVCEFVLFINQTKIRKDFIFMQRKGGMWRRKERNLDKCSFKCPMENAGRCNLSAIAQGKGTAKLFWGTGYPRPHSFNTCLVTTFLFLFQRPNIDNTRVCCISNEQVANIKSS